MRNKLLTNIVGNWLGIGADAVTGIVLTRIIVHAVGNSSYGIWVLVSGLLGYYGLLDLGTRNGLIRYVARHNATKDYDNLSSVVSTALATYVVIGLVVLLVTFAAMAGLDHLVAINNSAELSEGRTLVLVLGIGAAVGFPLTAFGGTLEGMQEFFRIGAVQAAANLTRAVFVIIAMKMGYGIVVVGILTVAFNILGGAINAVYMLRLYPQIRLAFTGVRRETWNTLAGFSLVTFWVAIANLLRFQTDSFVIGKVFGLAMITVFSFGTKILSYASEGVAAMAGVFTPAITHADALGDKAAVTRMTLTGNYLSSLLTFPGMTVLMFFGRTLIGLWVGHQYDFAYTVILIMGTPMALYMSQYGSTRMLYGVGQHKALAKILFFEGAANFILSITLAERMGVVGVAWGTGLPLAFTSVVLLPRLACRTLGSSYLSYWGQTQGRAFLIVLPLIAFFGVMTFLRPEQSLVEVGAEVAIGMGLYGAAVLNTFRRAKAVRAAA